MATRRLKITYVAHIIFLWTVLCREQACGHSIRGDAPERGCQVSSLLCTKPVSNPLEASSCQDWLQRAFPGSDQGCIPLQSIMNGPGKENHGEYCMFLGPSYQIGNQMRTLSPLLSCRDFPLEVVLRTLIPGSNITRLPLTGCLLFASAALILLQPRGAAISSSLQERK